MESATKALKSVHTSGLPGILEGARVSLAVSTYQSNRLILVRQSDPGQPGDLNTRFCAFDKPMGVCAYKLRLAVGTRQTICTYLDVPAMLARLPGEEVHDSCYAPRSVWFTGNVDIHEMAWDARGELWFVNTRFSCLCTATPDASFVPRWRPAFVSSLAPEDRCHLNGLALRDGQPRYVTALGMSDTPGGWRLGKASGGVLLDVARDQPLAEGLSMPHSPRWYRNRVWFLESGRGALCYLGDNGVVQDVAVLPGFVRGLDFAGSVAFVGLSKVRETATFSGLPLNREATQRTCGVWAVDIDTGRVLGFLRFEGDVEEIFSVTVLNGRLAPELLPADSLYLSDTYVLPDDVLDQVALTDPQVSNQLPATAFREGKRMLAEGRAAEAVDELHRCLQMEPRFPHARMTLGVALAEAGRLPEALTELTVAADREPDRADVLVSLGTVHLRLGAPIEARRAYEEAIRRDPDDAMAHANLGHLLLRSGDYERGFAEYEWCLPAASESPGGQHRWAGDTARDGRLLLVVDGHDLSSTLVLMRLIPAAAERFASLVVVGPDAWLPVLSGIAGVTAAQRAEDVRLADYDLQVNLERLPSVLGIASADCIPLPPYLDAASLPHPSLATTGTSDRAPVKMGLALERSWDGKDRAPVYDKVLDDLAALLEGKGLSLRALNAASVDVARDRNLRLEGQSPPGDLDCLASVISTLDGVIGSDGPAVCLAGAMSKPAWMVLGRAPGWWWPFGDRRSDWFPTVRIIDPTNAAALDLSKEFP